MPDRTVGYSHVLRRLGVLTVAGVMAATLVGVAWAGLSGFRNSAVGGISISADGVVGQPDVNARGMLLNELRGAVKTPSGPLGTTSPLRMISLGQLSAALETALRQGTGAVPDEVRYLAGIQRVQYVFVYPDAQDIVLAGPGEGWKIDDNANVVGMTTGRPVLRLDDLLVALRTVEQSRRDLGISCSIDPTPEGRLALNQVLQRQRRAGNVNPPVLEAAIKRAFGNQQVKITGVPATSYFSRVMVAADYRMKRLAMNLEPSPVAGLPSYLALIKQAGRRAANNADPRWWLACDYQPLATSEDRLAWELRGPGVKAMTEDELVTAEGQVEGTGRASPAAQKWADLMTRHYDELSVKEPVFGELRNLMDLCVVAALLEKEGLWERAGLEAPLLRDPQSEWKLEVWNAPKAVPPEVSFVRADNSWIVTASGGVQFTPWEVASRVEVAPQVADTRTKAAASGKNLWWQ